MTTKYLNPAETAARLGVSQATVTRWARAGRLTRLRRGGRVFFAADQVDALASPQPDGQRP